MIVVSASTLLVPLSMAALATASVGLWTLRVALTARGRKGGSALVAAVEAVVFALAFTRLGADLGAPERVGGYAAGVAIGTLLGLLVDERLSSGRSEVRVVVPGLHPCVIQSLHRRGWAVSGFTGRDGDGPVTVLFAAAADGQLPALLQDIRRIAPDAGWTIHRLGGAPGRSLPPSSARSGRRRPCRQRLTADAPHSQPMSS